LTPPLDSPELNEGAELAAAEVQRGAVRGATLLIGRSVALQGLTAIATIAIARLLTPRAYGVFAIAIAVQLFGRFLTDLGMSAALVRRREAPTLDEQRAVTAFMLLAGVVVAAAAWAIAFALLPAVGLDSYVARAIAIASLSLPLVSLRVVPIVQLERQLAYGRIIAIELSEVLSFYAFALPAAIAGLGAISLAGAVPVSAVAGAVTGFAVSPWPLGLSLKPRVLRPLLRFGIQVSARYPLVSLQDLGLVAILAAIGGQAAAGFYAVSQRLFSLPAAVASATLRVSFASLSRLPTDISRVRSATQAAGVVAVGTGFLLALVVGSVHPLIAVLFGERWLPAEGAVVGAAPGVLVFSSLGAVLLGLSMAEGRAGWPLTVTAISGGLTLALTLSLTPSLEATGAGIAAGAGMLALSLMLLVKAPRLARSGARAVWRALVVAGLAALAGNLAGQSTDAVSLALALAAAGTSWVALSVLLTKREFVLLIRLLREHAAALFSGAAESRSPNPDRLT
jgi:O-antigen/teichoic acid export membrane protein